ncbi:MAG: EamA family transporter RarD [Gammaproteobacteria bacterium]
MAENETRRGAALAVAAFTFWGFTPLYYKLLDSVGAIEVLAHRILWTVIFGCLVIQFRRGWLRLRDALRQPGTPLTLMASSILVSANWLIFIYAVQTDRVLDASLGYYINPLVNVLLGVVILGERMSIARGIAVALAATGTLVLATSHEGFPWIALSLAFSFGFYGLLRKQLDVPVVGGLVVETGYLLPVTAVFLGWLTASGDAAMPSQGTAISLLLMAGGPVTMLPLLWFTQAARRLPLSVIGLFQYIGPSLSFLLAVFVFDESFTRVHAVTFGCIWTGLVISTIDSLARARKIEALRREMVVADGSGRAE